MLAAVRVSAILDILSAFIGRDIVKGAVLDN